MSSSPILNLSWQDGCYGSYRGFEGQEKLWERPMELRRLMQRKRRRTNRGFTIEELLMSLAVSSLTIGGIISGYVVSSQNTEWTAYSIAAESLTVQRMEQARAARWDTLASPVADELTAANFPQVVQPLDVPVGAAEDPQATITTFIQTISTDPPLKSVRVECVWSYGCRGPFTNSFSTLRSPDQ